MKKLLKVVCLLLSCAMLTTMGAALAASDVGDHDQNIVMALQYDLGSFDTNSRWATEDWPFYYLVYDRLYEYDENCAAVPHLAEEITNLSDTVTQYRIHEGARFSDGSEIKASDCIASIQYAKESGLADDYYGCISAMDIVDDYTFTITTTYCNPQLALALADPLTSILPASFLEAAKADSSLWSNPICSGRYVLKSRVIGSSVELVPNEYFWDDATRAQNDSITFKITPEASTRTIMVQTGEADICDNFSATDIAAAEADPNVTMYSMPSARLFYIFLSMDDPIFAVKEVRQALNYAVDRDMILLVQEEGRGQVVECYAVPSGMGWMDNPAGYTHDVEKAKELLAAGGYPDGFTFDLTCDASFNSMAALIQAQLAEVGITMNIITIEQMADIIPLIDQGQCLAGVVAWNGPPEEIMNIGVTLAKNGIGSNNFSHYVNEELEAKWADGYDPDPEKRIAAYQEWQKILCEDCPWIPLYVNEQRALANSDLQGVEMSCSLPYNLYKLHY